MHWTLSLSGIQNNKRSGCVYYISSLYPCWSIIRCTTQMIGALFFKMQNRGKSIYFRQLSCCGDEMPQKQSLKSKREFDERARKQYDLLYKNECQNWRNKSIRQKKTSGFSLLSVWKKCWLLWRSLKDVPAPLWTAEKKPAKKKNFGLKPGNWNNVTS